MDVLTDVAIWIFAITNSLILLAGVCFACYCFWYLVDTIIKVNRNNS